MNDDEWEARVLLVTLCVISALALALVIKVMP